MIQESITPELLSTLLPLEVVGYLRTNGWTERAVVAGRVSYWQKPSAEDIPFEVAVPLDRGYRDYADRLEDVIDVLRVSEGRSPIGVFRNLQSTNSDIIRIRLLAKESADGTLPLDQGAELVEHARDLIMASACATAKPRAWYRNRRPPAAESYLRTVRLGQTEIGSYVLTVLSRVPPSLKSLETNTAPIPFERRVTTNLAKALDATRAAAEVAVATGELQAFREQATTGITVNLCDAIAGLAPEDPRSHDGLRIEFTWSSARPQIAAVPSTVVIPPDAVGVIAEAGRMLREFAPMDEFEFEGSVRRLEYKSDGEGGVATVVGSIDGQVRQVRVYLGQEDYKTAILAHKERLPVVCVGDIVREGRSLVMKAPLGLLMMNEDSAGLDEPLS